jgi:DNA-binding GntR family transcriptional regulator
MGTRQPHVPAKDRAYDFVKERILTGVYPGGDLLSEGEVADAVGVSRTPVREAFLLLEAEGLMRLYPKRGALIVPVSPDEIEDVMDTRLLVERHAAARVAERPPAGFAGDVETILAAQRTALDAGDQVAFVEADRDFHRAIVEAAGNAILARLYDQLRDRLRRMSATAIARDPAVAEVFLSEHRAIAAALGRGDGDGAGVLLARHLEGARGALQGGQLPD